MVMALELTVSQIGGFIQLFKFEYTHGLPLP